MLPLRFLTAAFNHPGRLKSTTLVATPASVSQPQAHVKRKISYPGRRKFGIDSRRRPGARADARHRPGPGQTAPWAIWAATTPSPLLAAAPGRPRRPEL